MIYVLCIGTFAAVPISFEPCLSQFPNDDDPAQDAGSAGFHLASRILGRIVDWTVGRQVNRSLSPPVRRTTNLLDKDSIPTHTDLIQNSNDLVPSFARDH